MLNKAMMSSEREDWRTPKALFKLLTDTFGPFDLDPCGTVGFNLDERGEMSVFYGGEEDDGLKRSWYGKVYCNPPYGRKIGLWIDKAVEEIRLPRRAELVVLLVPARTDTQWWSACVAAQAEVTLIEGRLQFEGAESGAPFPSALMVLRRRLPARLPAPRD